MKIEDFLPNQNFPPQKKKFLHLLSPLSRGKPLLINNSFCKNQKEKQNRE